MSGTPAIPAHVTQYAACEILNGPFVLQVEDITAVDTSCLSKEQNGKEEGKCYKLILSDGFIQLAAVEFQKIPWCNSNLALGTKVIVSTVECRRGVLFLTPACVALLESSQLIHDGYFSSPPTLQLNSVGENQNENENENANNGNDNQGHSEPINLITPVKTEPQPPVPSTTSTTTGTVLVPSFSDLNIVADGHPDILRATLSADLLDPQITYEVMGVVVGFDGFSADNGFYEFFVILDLGVHRRYKVLVPDLMVENLIGMSASEFLLGRNSEDKEQRKSTRARGKALVDKAVGWEGIFRLKYGENCWEIEDHRPVDVHTMTNATNKLLLKLEATSQAS
jgi:hypothetical protein